MRIIGKRSAIICVIQPFMVCTCHLRRRRLPFSLWRNLFKYDIELNLPTVESTNIGNLLMIYNDIWYHNHYHRTGRATAGWRTRWSASSFSFSFLLLLWPLPTQGNHKTNHNYSKHPDLQNIFDFTQSPIDIFLSPVCMSKDRKLLLFPMVRI